jgi:hypothetical protein
LIVFWKTDRTESTVGGVLVVIYLTKTNKRYRGCVMRKVAGWVLRGLSIIVGFWVGLALLMTIINAWKIGGFTMVQTLLSPFNLRYYLQTIIMILPVALLHMGAEKLLEARPAPVKIQDEAIDA